MFHTMTIAGLERQLPICKVTDELYIAGFVIFGDPELTVACARDLLKVAPEYDYIITRRRVSPWHMRWPDRQEMRSTFWHGKAPSCTCGIFSAWM